MVFYKYGHHGKRHICYLTYCYYIYQDYLLYIQKFDFLYLEDVTEH